MEIDHPPIPPGCPHIIKMRMILRLPLQEYSRHGVVCAVMEVEWQRERERLERLFNGTRDCNLTGQIITAAKNADAWRAWGGQK